jgi:polyisoprenoid-binding protein YceI
MRARLVALVFGLALAVTGTPARALDLARDRFDLDWAHSTIGFSIDFMGLTKVDGRFRRYNGTILYDEQDPGRSSVTVVIKADSIDTANDFRDKHLKTADFFDADKYPTIVFQSRRVERRGDGYLMSGPLTMHGVTKEIAIPFKRVHGRMKDMWENTRIGFLGTVRLDRRDFGIVGPPNWERVLDLGRLTIGHDVEVSLNVQGRIWNWEKIGGGEKSVAPVLLKTLEESGLDAALSQYRDLKASRPGDYDFSERQLNDAGHRLQFRGRFREAIALLELNAREFPASAAAQDSLANLYAAAGDRDQAIAAYRRSLELDSFNANAMEMLRYLKAEGMPPAAGSR